MQCVIVLRIFIILLTFMNAAEGIKCFQCSSQRDPGCAELGSLYGVSPDSPADWNVSAEALKYYRECEDSYGSREPFCRKMFQTIFARDKLEVVTRSCGWELHPRLECYEFENKGHAETVCQCFEDGCNHAPRPRPLAVLSVLLMTLMTLL